jgi:hypothetical protein
MLRIGSVPARLVSISELQALRISIRLNSPQKMQLDTGSSHQIFLMKTI